MTIMPLKIITKNIFAAKWRGFAGASYASYSAIATQEKWPFRYSVRVGERSPLSPQECEKYETDGYILVKGLLGLDQVNLLNQHFDDIANKKVPYRGSVMMRDVELVKKMKRTGVVTDGTMTITKLQDWVWDEVLFGYCKAPQILDYVKCLIGPEGGQAIHTMYINKPPDLGKGTSRHPLHQDLWYFPLRPEDRIAGAWTALEVIGPANGCLVVMPGSHMQPLHIHEYPNDSVVNKAYHGIQGMSTEADAEKQVPVEMEPGDTVFFHPLLIHGSTRNLSSGSRRAISCHYAGADCRFIDLKGTIQEPLVHEVEKMAARRFEPQTELSFNDIWRMKSRPVYGKCPEMAISLKKKSMLDEASL